MPVGRAGGGYGPPAAASYGTLAVHSSGRYLTRNGVPFLLHGDAAWAIAAQLTNAEITQYLDDRKSRGVNCILFSAPEPYYTSQTPAYNNVDGVAPFATMSPMDWASTPTAAYWSRVDHLVNSANARGMVVIFNPAYSSNGDETSNDGWDTELLAESDADLQTYGAWLANRYTQGNVIWSMGGDLKAAATTTRDKQYQIIVGIRSVRTSDIVMGHHLQDGNDAYPVWNGKGGWSLNIVYGWENSGNYFSAMGATAYGRAGPIPFLAFEGQYEQEGNPVADAALLRRQSYTGILSGACGQLFGNSPIWHFEAPFPSRAPFTYSGTWESNLNSTGAQQQAYVKALFAAYSWWLLVPKTDTSLVSSALGSGATVICPALSSDGTFAMIWVPSSQTITVVTNALTGVAGNVKIRRYNPTDGTYAVINAGVAKTPSQSVATGAEGVIVIEAA